jgi:hypothetical protein
MTDPNMRTSMMDVRRWAFYNIGAYMTRTDTGIVHGPWEGPEYYEPPFTDSRGFGWDAVPDTRDVRPERMDIGERTEAVERALMLGADRELVGTASDAELAAWIADRT